MQWSYEEFADFLYREAAACSPAALHGALAGALVRDHAVGDAEARRVAALWLAVEPLSESLGDAVEGMIASLRAQLDDPELSFAPLIPSEGSGLTSRLAALGEWCAAFSPEVQARRDWDEEAQAAVADLAEIAELDPTAPADEDSERDFMELVEYVRVVVFNLYALSSQSGGAVAAPLH